MNRYKRLRLVSLFSLIVLIGVTFCRVSGAEERVLVFGRVHDDPVRSVKYRQEFVDYLAKKLAPVGVAGGRILVVEKMHLLTQALKAGKVDLFHDSAAPSLVISKWSGSLPLLRQWKYGEADYHGVIVVKKDAGINTLDDLKGKVIAFEEAHSTSASVLPRMLFEEKKLKLVEIKPNSTPKSDVVSYMHFSDGSPPNLLMTGRVDAAAITGGDFARLPPQARDNLKIIGQTITAPRQILSVRKDLDSKIVKAITETLVGMDKYPEGQGVLKRQQNTTKFDQIPPESLEQMKVIGKYLFSSLEKEVDSW